MWREAASGQTRSILDPGDGSEVARVAEGGCEDTESAIAAARKAFDAGPWRQTTWTQRADLLDDLADRVAAQRDELALVETRDTGKTVTESLWDMDDVAAVFRYYGRLAREQQPAHLEAPGDNTTSVVVAEPVGVCALILPWNYPLLQASWKLAPALAAGCTVVIKPSELTPLSTLRMTELMHEMPIPAGVVNTVLGPGPTVGATMAESHDVDLVSFTGGGATGRRIMRAAAGNLKRIALELGGKNPHLIFADADLDLAVDAALNGGLFHAGQVCSAGARLLVEDTIADRFVAALAKQMAAVRVGRGTVADTQMGPLISAEHREKVHRHVRQAVADGATLVVGGNMPADPDLAEGFFYPPTLLADCTPDMAITRAEVFGPVISVERFATEDEAVARANDTEYGLAAGVRTNDEERIARVTAALRFGTVWANDYNIYFPQAPWGGFKQSGIGRELGRVGLHEYLELKHVFRNHAPAALRWFGDQS